MNPEDNFHMPYIMLLLTISLTGAIVFLMRYPIAHFISLFAAI